jgi:hypothetical protein
MATHTFKVGDRVRISKDSEYYGKNDRNPADVDGTVKTVGEARLPFVYYVSWDTGDSNSYREGDLVPAMENTKAEHVTVAAEFVLEAYTAACPVWKKKIKDVVPNLYAILIKVPKAFIREAYKAADSEWKSKLEDKFEFLRGPEYARIVEDEDYDTQLYYKTEDRSTTKRLKGFHILNGLAGCQGIPKSAKSCGLYISNDSGFSFKDTKVVVKETPGGIAIYFEKK